MFAASVKHVDERLRRVFQSVHDRLGRLEPAVAPRRRDVGQERAAPALVIADDETLHANAFSDDQRKVARARRLLVVLRDHAARRDASERIERGESRFELRAAHVVEVDVDPAGSRIAQERANVAVLVVKRGVESQFLAQVRRFLIAARAPDHALRAVHFRELPGNAADGARRGRYEETFARFKIGDVEQTDPCGEPGQSEDAEVRARRRSRGVDRARVR